MDELLDDATTWSAASPRWSASPAQC